MRSVSDSAALAARAVICAFSAKALRTEAGVHRLRPGLTGWAQINGRDEIPIPQKVGLDAEYLRRASFGFDLLILARTVLPVATGKGVTR